MNNNSQDIANMGIQANVHKTLLRKQKFKVLTFVEKISSSSTQHKHVQVWQRSPFKPSNKYILCIYDYKSIRFSMDDWFAKWSRLMDTNCKSLNLQYNTGGNSWPFLKQKKEVLQIYFSDGKGIQPIATPRKNYISLR